MRALIYDAKSDVHRGVILHVRGLDGSFKRGDKIDLIAAQKSYTVTEVGKFTPKPTVTESLGAGEVGYMVAGIKTLADVNIGDTITLSNDPTPDALPGYTPPMQMLFCDLYPGSGTSTSHLREAM